MPPLWVHSRHAPTPMALKELKAKAYAGRGVLVQGLIAAADSEHAAGRILDAVYRGTVGVAARRPSPLERSSLAPLRTEEARQAGKANVTFRAPVQASGDDFSLIAQGDEPEAPSGSSLFDEPEPAKTAAEMSRRGTGGIHHRGGGDRENARRHVGGELGRSQTLG